MTPDRVRELIAGGEALHLERSLRTDAGDVRDISAPISNGRARFAIGCAHYGRAAADREQEPSEEASQCAAGPKAQGPFHDSSRFARHKVTQVRDYWRRMDVMTVPMKEREPDKPRWERR